MSLIFFFKCDISPPKNTVMPHKARRLADTGSGAVTTVARAVQFEIVMEQKYLLKGGLRIVEGCQKSPF